MSISDWSSDVCSSDLIIKFIDVAAETGCFVLTPKIWCASPPISEIPPGMFLPSVLPILLFSYPTTEDGGQSPVPNAEQRTGSRDTHPGKHRSRTSSYQIFPGIHQEAVPLRSEEHTSEIQSIMSISY